MLLSRCSTFFLEGLFFLLVAAQEFEVTAEDVLWANKVRSQNVLFSVVCLLFSFWVPLFLLVF